MSPISDGDFLLFGRLARDWVCDGPASLSESWCCDEAAVEAERESESLSFEFAWELGESNELTIADFDRWCLVALLPFPCLYRGVISADNL